MNKMRAYRAYFLQLSKSQWEKKILLFCQGNQGDANFWVGQQNYVISAALH